MVFEVVCIFVRLILLGEGVGDILRLDFRKLTKRISYDKFRISLGYEEYFFSNSFKGELVITIVVLWVVFGVIIFLLFFIIFFILRYGYWFFVC